MPVPYDWPVGRAAAIVTVNVTWCVAGSSSMLLPLDFLLPATVTKLTLEPRLVTDLWLLGRSNGVERWLSFKPVPLWLLRGLWLIWLTDLQKQSRLDRFSIYKELCLPVRLFNKDWLGEREEDHLALYRWHSLFSRWSIVWTHCGGQLLFNFTIGIY